MTTDNAASVQGVALRAVKLDATGAPLVGTKSGFVTKAFMSLGFTPEYTAGDEIEEKGANGEVCVYYQMPDVLKRVTLNIAICAPDPELSEILIGGTLLAEAPYTVTNKALTSNVATLTIGAHSIQVGDSITVAGVDATFNGTAVVTAADATTISYAKTATNVASTAASGTVTNDSANPSGWAAPASGTIATPNGVGLEVWSRAIVGGKPAVVNPYWRWVFPYAQLKLDGERVLENGRMANVFAGYGLGNASFGLGPADDWPFPTTSAYQYARDDSAPSNFGYLAVT